MITRIWLANILFLNFKRITYSNELGNVANCRTPSDFQIVHYATVGRAENQRKEMGYCKTQYCSGVLNNDQAGILEPFFPTKRSGTFITC